MFYNSILLLLTDQISFLSHNTHLIFEEKKVLDNHFAFWHCSKPSNSLWKFLNMAAFFIIEIHVDFQVLIDGCLTAKRALQAWPLTRDGRFQGLGRRFSYGYARARAPSCEKEISERSRTVSWKRAVKVLFSRETIPHSLSCKSAHTSIPWDKKTGDLKPPTCKIGK